MVSGCLAPITQKAFIRQGAWSFLGWWLDRRYVQDRGNLEPQQYPRKRFRDQPVCLLVKADSWQLGCQLLPIIVAFLWFSYLWGLFFFERLGDFTKAGVKNHQFWSLVFVMCRSEISTSGANRKKRAGVFFVGKMSCWPKKPWRVTSCLRFFFGCFLRMFFSVVSHTVWLW